MPHLLGGEGLRRTLTLPPAADSPRSARRFVVGVLDDSLDADTVDTALLLVTELVTNVVVHAGTHTTIDIRHDANGLVITVSDRNPVPLDLLPAGHLFSRPGQGIEDLREDGRGLALVSALSAAWGTEHDHTGKKVWFRLRTGGDPPTDSPDRGVAWAAEQTVAPTTPVDDEGTVSTLGTSASRNSVHLLSPELSAVLSVEDEIGELLAQLVDVLPAPAAGLVFRQSRHGNDTPEIVAASGPAGAERDARRIPLDSRDGLVGELLLWSPVLTEAEVPWSPPGQRRPGTRGLASDDTGGDLGSSAASPEAELPGSPGRERRDDIEEHIRRVARWITLALGGAHLRRVEERRIGMLSFLAEASDLLAGSLDTERSLALLARLPVPRLARWCTVHLRREDGEARLAAVGHVDEAQTSDLSAWAADQTGPLATQVRAALADQAVRVVTIDGSPTVIAAMRARRRVLGALALGRAKGHDFEADEIDLLADLARRAAFAVDNARLFHQQVEVVAALQAALLPPELPSIDGVELGSSYRAARPGLEVGGDFFDLVPSPDGAWTIVIGDVCGKGPEAANVTGVARAVLRLLASQHNGLPDVMMALNRALRDSGPASPSRQGRFCTLAAAELHPSGPPQGAGPEVTAAGRSGPRPRRVVSICMAGHPLPIVLRADGQAVFVAEPGTLLGVLDDSDAAFPEEEISLAAGDSLVLYTDGVVEARRGRELFGDDRLLDTVRECAGMSAQGIADRVRAAAERFAGGRLRDDVAVLVARIRG